jgi:predicted nucleic acid-binding protein
LGGRDAVHAATALRNGLTVVISPDRAFDGIPHLRRFDPTLDPSEIR